MSDREYNTASFNARGPRDLKASMKKVAGALDISFSSMIIRACADCMDRKDYMTWIDEETPHED